MNVAVSLTFYGVGGSCSLWLADLPCRYYSDKTRHNGRIMGQNGIEWDNVKKDEDK